MSGYSIHVLPLSWVANHHFSFNSLSCIVGKSFLIIGNLSRGNNKQSGQAQNHDRAKKLVESMMNEFRLIFSFITAGKLKLGIACGKSYRSVLRFASSLLSYNLVNNTVCKFSPLIVIILRKESS